MVNLTVIGLYFSLETVNFAFYGPFPIRMRMSPYSTNDVCMDLFLGFVSEMESLLILLGIKLLADIGQHRLTCFNPYSAGIDFSRQNLTSVDVRF